MITHTFVPSADSKNNLTAFSAMWVALMMGKLYTPVDIAGKAWKTVIFPKELTAVMRRAHNLSEWVVGSNVQATRVTGSQLVTDQLYFSGSWINGTNCVYDMSTTAMKHRPELIHFSSWRWRGSRREIITSCNLGVPSLTAFQSATYTRRCELPSSWRIQTDTAGLIWIDYANETVNSHSSSNWGPAALWIAPSTRGNMI